jgi:DNA-directed RNA polymerase subunit L
MSGWIRPLDDGTLSTLGPHVFVSRENPIFVMLKRPKIELRGMELRVIEKEANELSIEIAGEDHTFMNVLKGTLLEHEGVAAATYDVNPEQSGGQTEPILTVKTEDGTEPLDTLEDAAGDLRDKTTAFRDAYENAA